MWRGQRREGRSIKLASTFALLLTLAGRAEAEQSHLVIIVGLGGEKKYSDAFHETAVSLVGAAEKKLGIDPAHIVYLGEKPSDPALAVYRGRSTRQAVETALRGVAQTARPGDLVLILLIGHGSYQAGESRFNLPGPDMSASDFAPLLAALRSQQVAFVNAASASGDFVKALSGKGRTVVTATKSALERNQTEFARYFVEAFTEDGADADKDGRISMLEAFTYARREVQRFYDKDRRLLTEHALLDDDGDGVGSTDAGAKTADGALAARLFLATAAEERVADARDARLVELRQERREVERQLEALKARKQSTAPAQYEQQLEKLLLELAVKDEAIRRREAERPR
jgi:hypothetical protein